MPRVLHVISGLKVGGAEMALLRLIGSSRDSEYTHSVVALTPGGGMHSRFEEAGIDVVCLDLKRAPISQFVRLVAHIRKQRPDVVQTWMYHADLLGGLAACLAGNSNVIWGVRTTDAYAGGTRAVAVIRKICAWISSWMPATIVCAAEASRRAHIAIGYVEKRMCVIPNGFDFAKLRATPENRAQLRAEWGFSDDHIVVGTLGRFNLAKDQKTFVIAAAFLAQQHPGVRFLMVGRDITAENTELCSWIHGTGYAEHFLLLGERADVPACLSAMDVFCLSSRTEGFPNALGEAMALGLPSVTTDVGDAAMLLGDTGLVVPREDPGKLAQALSELLRMSREERLKLGDKASKRVRAEFSMERARERFESLYQKVLKAKKGSR